MEPMPKGGVILRMKGEGYRYPPLPMRAGYVGAKAVH